jgi:hypothetical protein
MKRRHVAVAALAGLVVVTLVWRYAQRHPSGAVEPSAAGDVPSPEAAGEWTSGVVEAIEAGQLVVRTSPSGAAHWQVDRHTRVIRPVHPGDWVSARIDPSGHVRELRSLDHAVEHEAVLQGVYGDVLLVKQGNATAKWKLVPASLVDGAGREALAAGDRVKAKVYRDGTLAEVHLVSHASR